MSDERKPHYMEHRKRLRERFRKTGFEGFQDYEAIELLLTYTIPRRDVKPIAKALIGRFKTFQGVIDAPFEELTKVNGVGEYTATHMRSLKECVSLYLRERVMQKQQISSTLSLLDYCRAEMSTLRDEQFRAVFLNSQNEVIADEVICEGTVNQSVVYPRKVMERALYHKTTAMIFVHNHPSGNNKPSNEDLILTEMLVKTAKGLQIRVHDHIIISNTGYFSFLEAGLLGPL